MDRVFFEAVNGQRPITADTALRPGLFFSHAGRFRACWLSFGACC